MINIDEITIGQAKEIISALGMQAKTTDMPNHPMIGKFVIIRTYSAGCWFGKLIQKDGNEVILKNARRMWRWWAAESISLSACAIHGINRKKSKIVEPVEQVWLEAIEIIPCTDIAIESISGADHVAAE